MITVVTEPPGGDEPLGAALDGAGVVAGTSPVGVLTAVGISGLDFEPGATEDGTVAGTVSVSVTGHTVVETAMVEVTTVVESAGQLTTVGAQLVMVTCVVEYTVEVVMRVVDGAIVMTGTDDEGTRDEELPPVADGMTGVEADVVLGTSAGPQLNSMLWIPRSRSSPLLSSGRWKLIATAPPHCSLVMWVSSGEHEATFLQDEPSGIS